MSIEDLFASKAVASTPAVASIAGISEAAAREWAGAHGVGRAGNAYGWTEDDVRALLDDVGDDDANDEDDDCETAVFVENPGDEDDDDVDDDEGDDDEGDDDEGDDDDDEGDDEDE